MDVSGKEESASKPNRFNIRFIALGAFLIFLTLSGAEWLIWRVVDNDSRTFFYEALDRVNDQEITPEEKASIRKETLHRLATPAVIGIGVVVLLAPFGVGMLVGARSHSWLSGPLSVFLGFCITLIAVRTFSAGAAVACLLYSATSVLGHSMVKKIQKWHIAKE